MKITETDKKLAEEQIREEFDLFDIEQCRHILITERSHRIAGEREMERLREGAFNQSIEIIRQSHHLICSCDGNGCPRVAHIVAKLEAEKRKE